MTPSFDGSKLEIGTLMFDRDGNLWVGTVGKGSFAFTEMSWSTTTNEGLSSDTVSALFEDREGIVWAGTTNGIDSFRDPRLSRFRPWKAWGRMQQQAFWRARDGTIWIANAGSLDHIVNGSVSSIRTGKGLPGHQVASMLEDRAGNLWVGVDDGLYLFKNGRFRRLPEPNHQPLGLVVGMTEDIDGNIWAECAGNPRKLVRIRDFQVVEEFTSSQVPRGPHARARSTRRNLDRNSEQETSYGFANGALARSSRSKQEGNPVSHQIVARGRRLSSRRLG